MHNFHFPFLFFSATEFSTFLYGNNNKETPIHKIPIPQRNKINPTNMEEGTSHISSMCTARAGLKKQKATYIVKKSIDKRIMFFSNKSFQ